jgi:hypothetical protein
MLRRSATPNILGALVEARQAITELDARLDRIESKITA